MLNNKDLLIQLKQGNIKAYESIYWKYHEALYSNIYKIIKDLYATEDLLQEVFISLWNSRDSLDVEKPVANWLFVVSYNKSITYLKESAKNPVFHFERPDIPATEDDLKNLYTEQQWEILQKGLETLSPQKRKVFQLCKLESKTYSEAATEMQISKHTVKEYLGEAMSLLKSFAQTEMAIFTVIGISFLSFFIFI